jgi:ubiquinone/menaquinone biosynthesis C-methylase UbiE
MLKTTKQHLKYWRDRKIDWGTHYTATWNHPHRMLITMVLKSFPWMSLWEVGCGSGPNLIRLVREGFTDRQLGGSDVNPDAIELASKTFQNGKFHCEPSDDILLSDQSVDVMLSDAHLIYIGPLKIKKVLGEMIRVTRNHIVLCEFHSKYFWKRWWFRLRSGYNAYDYKKLLESLGCYDVQIAKIPKEFWPGTPWEEWGHVITAKIVHV